MQKVLQHPYINISKVAKDIYPETKNPSARIWQKMYRDNVSINDAAKDNLVAGFLLRQCCLGGEKMNWDGGIWKLRLSTMKDRG